MQSQSAAEPQKSLQYEAFQDKNSPPDWRVEGIDSKSGDVFVAIFPGALAQERAKEYAQFKSGQ
ncbi:MAG TPA: hypothetical protein VG206_26790 [Terriglobia bacterium]|nr:hypothetical protein [Terriglobia bacterium]